jgi:hypothetical protein
VSLVLPALFGIPSRKLLLISVVRGRSRLFWPTCLGQ